MDEGTIVTRLTGTHWAIAGGGLLLLMLVLILNCCYKNLRWRAVQEARSGHVSAEFLTLRDLPKHAYEIIAMEAERERSTKVHPAWRDACGWGRPHTEYAGVHFKTFIATSPRIIESHATQRDPALTACQVPPHADASLATDVANYLNRLLVALDGELDDDLCDQYLAFYRNARLPHGQCNEQEFRSFLGVFQEILRTLKR